MNVLIIKENMQITINVDILVVMKDNTIVSMIYSHQLKQLSMYVEKIN